MATAALVPACQSSGLASPAAGTCTGNRRAAAVPPAVASCARIGNLSCCCLGSSSVSFLRGGAARILVGHGAVDSSSSSRSSIGLCTPRAQGSTLHHHKKILLHCFFLFSFFFWVFFWCFAPLVLLKRSCIVSFLFYGSVFDSRDFRGPL
jgi:hypothetical protein